MSFGQYLKKRLKELKIRHYQFAEMVGVSYMTVVTWTTGKVLPKAKYIPSIALTLKATEGKVYRMMGVKTKKNTRKDFFIIPVLHSRPSSFDNASEAQDDEIILSPNLLPLSDPEQYRFFACIIEGRYFIFTPDFPAKNEETVIVELPVQKELSMGRYFELEGQIYFSHAEKGLVKGANENVLGVVMAEVKVGK
jgi:transcriptional regulator with XRE-family HTH domain